METITQIEVTTISIMIVGRWWDSQPDRQFITNTFIFPTLSDAKTFANRCINRHTTVVVTDVTDEKDEVLFNSKSFSKINEAKKAVKSL